MATTSDRAELARNVAKVVDRLAKNDVDADRDAVVALARSEPALERQRRESDPGPSGTRRIQTDYEAEFYRRFRRIKGLVRETVVANDALRLGDDSTSTPASLEANETDPDWWRAYVFERQRDGVVNADPVNDFPFRLDDEKIDAFLGWLREAQDDEILEVIRRSRAGDVVAREQWQNVYVRQAYSKGAEYANARLREQGVDPESVDTEALFNKAIHADAVGVLYTRNFRELEGITEAMDQQISRVLADGFTQGYNPRKMARELNDRVEKVGLTRARTLARTETINAHSTATLNRYEEMLGADAEVTGSAEWVTAGDNDVCTICASLEGTTYTIDEARGLIPIHPNCRCTWIPVVRGRGS